MSLLDEIFVETYIIVPMENGAISTVILWDLQCLMMKMYSRKKKAPVGFGLVVSELQYTDKLTQEMRYYIMYSIL